MNNDKLPVWRQDFFDSIKKEFQVGEKLSFLEPKSSYIPFKVGMNNPYNNCYINATIQAFFALPEFYKLMRTTGQEYGKIIFNRRSSTFLPMNDLMMITNSAFSPFFTQDFVSMYRFCDQV